jgi:hypothetical protein
MQTEISGVRESETPCVRRQHAPDGIPGRLPRLPQCPEGWNFEISAGQSESDRGYGVDRKKVGGNPRSQFVDFEYAGRHAGNAGGRKA